MPKELPDNEAGKQPEPQKPKKPADKLRETRTEEPAQPEPLERLLIAWQEFGGTEGQLLSVLRADKILGQMDSLEKLTAQQVAALEGGVNKLYERSVELRARK